ncbi:MAG TPA: HAD family phosphatase [Conexibacter sp.]|jgi:putative hydrolase of the HAD superfamily|nr:HAD family phosphatase [Conexibacter sp.]
MSRIEAIISDFGGVLTTPLLDAFLGLQQQRGIPLEAFGAALARAAGENGGTNPLYELETGRLTELQFATQLGAALRAELGRDVDLARFGETFFDHLHPNDELFAFMRGLRERGYRMAILTNNVREWEPLWRSMLPIDELFELVVDSGFEGVRKPDPRIYEVTLERLGIAAEATLFVDDMEINCDAARALGMQAVWFRSNAQAIGEIEQALAA